MKHVLQPRSKADVRKLIHSTALQILILRDGNYADLCGQACVAMITGCTLDDAIIATEQYAKTNCADLAHGLKFFGLRSRVVMSPVRWQRYRKAILNVHLPHQRKNHRQHWVVSERGRIYNPTDPMCESLKDIDGVELSNGTNPIDLCLVIR
jgi:hypothetical protein